MGGLFASTRASLLKQVPLLGAPAAVKTCLPASELPLPGTCIRECLCLSERPGSLQCPCKGSARRKRGSKACSTSTVPQQERLQDGFKKAAYLSTGSVDSRPTFQRDAVDDDATGSGLGLEGPNAISWKDMHLGRGPLQGAAYGSLVMPQFKGGRKADRQKKLPHIAPEVRAWPSLEARSLPGLLAQAC